jgi:hypothetical protein
VSKHTTCGDVDEVGVKILFRVLGCRCRRRDVDVGAVLLGMNKTVGFVVSCWMLPCVILALRLMGHDMLDRGPRLW